MLESIYRDKGTVGGYVSKWGSKADSTLKMDYAAYSKLLETMSEADILTAIRESRVYVSETGEIVSRSFKGTKLNGIIPDTIPTEYVHEVKYDVFIRYIFDEYMETNSEVTDDQLDEALSDSVATNDTEFSEEIDTTVND